MQSRGGQTVTAAFVGTKLCWMDPWRHMHDVDVVSEATAMAIGHWQTQNHCFYPAMN
jgi:hypothetical protein